MQQLFAMVLLSELVSVSITALAISAVVLNSKTYTSIMRSYIRCQFSVCASSIASFPITYVAARILLENESKASVVAIYFTVIILNYSYMTAGEWSRKDWGLRFFSMFLTLTTMFIYLGYVGLDDVAKVAAKEVLDVDLKFRHAVFVFITSWRFFLVYCVLSNDLIQRIPTASRMRRRWKALIGALRVVLIWVLVRFTGTKGAPTPWDAIDKVLLSDNSLFYVTFGLITLNMGFDICSALWGDDSDETMDWERAKELLQLWIESGRRNQQP